MRSFLELPLSVRRCFVVEPNGCWLWTRPLDIGGYGRVQKDKRTKKAHRFVYEFLNGDVPRPL